MRQEFDITSLPKSRKEALSLKAQYYFTGKPCSHGHHAPRSVWGRCLDCYRNSWADPSNEKIYTYTREFYRKNPHKRLVNQARVRAKRKGLAFDITYDDVTIPPICPVLGIPLKSHQGKRLQDDSATIDRIDSSRGYTRDNIVVISWRANRLKNDATVNELEQIVKFYKNYNNTGN